MSCDQVRARIIGIAIISLFAALGAVVLVSRPALAWVRTTVHLADGGAGPCLFWGPRGHSFMIDARGTPDVPGLSAFSAIRDGFDTWADAGCSDLVFPDLGLSTNPADRVVGYFPGQYNRNLVLFRTASCDNGAVPPSDSCLVSGGCGNKYDCWDHDSSVIATTTTTTNRATGQMLDADIEFNDATAADGTKYTFTTIDSPPCADSSQSNCVNIDVQNTATHEEGHTIGLGHSLESTATMYATAPMGETSKRHLAQDDLDAICTIYPKGAQTLTCLGGPIELTASGESDHAGCGCTSSGSAAPSLEGSLLAIALFSLFRARRVRAAI